jgi:hypothetical protein
MQLHDLSRREQEERQPQQQIVAGVKSPCLIVVALNPNIERHEETSIPLQQDRQILQRTHL